ncbi:G3E family GTPase [Amorphus suaedae]
MPCGQPLNKVDLVEPDHVAVIHDWIGAYLQRIRIVEARQGDVPLEILLAVGRFDPVSVMAAWQANGDRPRPSSRPRRRHWVATRKSVRSSLSHRFQMEILATIRTSQFAPI